MPCSGYSAKHEVKQQKKKKKKKTKSYLLKTLTVNHFLENA